MKVLFDITTLGIGYKNAKDRTGIARVVENLAAQLINNEKCELTFCAGMGIMEVDFSLKYLKHSNTFSDIPFSLPPFFKSRLRNSIKRMEVFNVLHDRNEKKLPRELSKRILHRALTLEDKGWNYCTSGLINPTDVREADIYHSPFLPIPKQIRKAAKKSVFLTSHDIIALLFPHFVVPSIGRLVKEIVESITPDTWVLCVSEATRYDLLNYLGTQIDPNKTIVTHLAASDLFYVNKDSSLKEKIKIRYNIPDVPYILSVCTLEPRKNITQVIKAFANLIKQERIPDLNLVLVGGRGWLFDDIFKEIEDSGDLKKRIVVPGYVEDEDLSVIYSNALMFVYPSYYEGFGLPPLEAMKCGTPVITSNTSSLPEVVGKGGLMIDPTDLSSLCNAMLTIYANSGLRQTLVEGALETANLFSWRRCADQTIEAYRASIS